MFNNLTALSEDYQSLKFPNIKLDILSNETFLNSILSLKERLNKIYSKHTGKTVDEISDSLERDNFMTAEEAKKFGLIDSVVEKRK